MKKDKQKHIKKIGFKTPEDYFETLEDVVFAKMSSDLFPKIVGLKIPDGYFDTIEDGVFGNLNPNKGKNVTGFIIPEDYLLNIEDKVLKTIKKEPKVINLRSIFLKRFIPIAAAASLLLFIYINFNKKPDVYLDQLASTDIEQWIDNDLITFDAYDITEAFADVELESQPIFEEEDMLDYLNGTDIESLILEN